MADFQMIGGPCPECADGLLQTRTSKPGAEFRRVYLRCDRCDYRPPSVLVRTDEAARRRRFRRSVVSAQPSPLPTLKRRRYDRSQKGGGTMMMMPQGVGDDSGLIDFREAARLANLRESDVLRMARQGLFPDFRNIPIGNVTYLLFSRFDVEAWIAAGRPRVSEGREADFRVTLREGDE